MTTAPTQTPSRTRWWPAPSPSPTPAPAGRFCRPTRRWPGCAAATGLVGWGEALRIDRRGPDRFADAERAWTGLLAHAVVRDEVAPARDRPGRVRLVRVRPHDSAPAGGVLVVPQVVLGRRAGTTGG